MKKFITPEVEMRELFASNSVMADISAIAVSDESTAGTTFVDYDDSDASGDYGMWKGNK